MTVVLAAKVFGANKICVTGMIQNENDPIYLKFFSPLTEDVTHSSKVSLKKKQ